MSTAIIDPIASVRFYLAAEKSPNTRRASFSKWHDVKALMAETIDPARVQVHASGAVLMSDLPLRNSSRRS
jgi:hypothetical protein